MRTSTALLSMIVLTAPWLVAPPRAWAEPVEQRWTEQGDFESNDATTGEGTTLHLLDTTSSPGTALLAAIEGYAVTSHQGNATHRLSNIAVDATAAYLIGLTGALDDRAWRLEKRDLVTGDLITDFGVGGAITMDPSSDDDSPGEGLIDGGELFVTGNDGSPGDRQLRIEKRDAATGALITAFGNGGVVESNPTNNDDGGTALALHATGLIIGGVDGGGSTGVNPSQWRIEKRDRTTGALISAFGNGGVITADHGVEGNNVRDVLVFGDELYVLGTDRTPGDVQWRLEKRDVVTGALVSAFGSGGAVVVNPTPGDDNDRPVAMAADASGLFVTGAEHPGIAQWRIEKRDHGTGGLVASFGSGGVVTTSFSGSNGGYPGGMVRTARGLFVAGYDHETVGFRWRTEGRDPTTGALLSDFGTGGVVSSDPGPYAEYAYGIAGDETSVYTVGEEVMAVDYSIRQWRFEKYPVTPFVTTGHLGGEDAAAVGLRVDAGDGLGIRWTELSFAAPTLASSQAIKLAVKTSADGTSWQPAVGGDGEAIDWTTGSGNYVGQAEADATARVDLSAVPEARFTDIVVRLESAGTDSPALEEVVLTGCGREDVVDATCDGQDDDCDGEIDEDVVGDGDCDDGLFCNGEETCAAGCQPGEPPDCDDHDPCTADSCSEQQRSCAHEPIPDCHGDDGGCGCAVVGRRGETRAWWLVGMVLALARRRQTRGRPER